MEQRAIKIFLRLAISLSFLSAVADRFGMWSKEVSVWGNWDNFLTYTQIINPWAPNALIPFLGIVSTAAEILFAFCLIIGYRTELFAKLSGILLLLFGAAMTVSTGIKGPLDYSVFSAAAGAFALSLFKEKFYEVDALFSRKNNLR